LKLKTRRHFPTFERGHFLNDVSPMTAWRRWRGKGGIRVSNHQSSVEITSVTGKLERLIIKMTNGLPYCNQHCQKVSVFGN